jgi:hypothetical protein
VLVLKYLVQSQLHLNPSTASTSQSPLTIISHLARRIDDIKHAQARACVLWLVGQYAEERTAIGGGGGGGIEGVAEWAPDVLRKAAKMFTHEVPCFTFHPSIQSISHSSHSQLQITGTRSQAPNHHPRRKIVRPEPNTPHTPAFDTIRALPREV